MHSYRHFTPGKTTEASKIIHYEGKNECVCRTESYNKNMPQANSSNISNKMRISQQIQNTVGGRIAYSLANIPTINYLGRSEGQYGGGGRPPSNFLVGRPSFH
jgi:hypothetical protein